MERRSSWSLQLGKGEERGKRQRRERTKSSSCSMTEDVRRVSSNSRQTVSRGSHTMGIERKGVAEAALWGVGGAYTTGERIGTYDVEKRLIMTCTKKKSYRSRTEKHQITRHCKLNFIRFNSRFSISCTML